MKSKISITIENNLLKSIDSQIDGIKIRNRSQAIEGILSKNIGQSKIAAILASKMNDFRFLKKINNEKIIMHLVKKLQNFGFKKAYFVGEKIILSKIIETIGTGNEYSIEFEYVEDQNPLGSAASLSLLKNKIKSAFMVIPADNYFEFDLNSFWNFHSKNSNLLTLAITYSSQPSKLGAVELSGEKVIGFGQKSKDVKSYLVWSGIMISEPEILFYSNESIEHELIPNLIKKNLAGGFVFTGEWKNIE